MERPATGMSSAWSCQSTTLLLLLSPLSLQDGHQERHRSSGSDGGGSSGPSQLQNRLWIRDHRYHHVVLCIDQDLSSAPHPVGPWGRAQPGLGPLLFLADGAVTTTPVSNTPNCHQLDGFLTGMTASPATTLTTRLHALSVISHSPSINTTTTEESPRWAKTLYGQVPGRSSLAERKEAGVLGTAGPSNGVSQACQENFPDSDSPIPTAPPPRRKLHAESRRATTAMPPFRRRHARDKASCTPNITTIAHISQAAVKRPLSQIQVQTKEGPRGTRLLRCAWTTASVSG